MTNSELDHKELLAIKHLQASLNQTGKMPSVRALMAAMDYRSPRSAALLLERLADKGVLVKRENGKYQLKDVSPSATTGAVSTVEVPLVGTTACGGPIFAEENVEAYYKISNQIARPSHQYFFLRAQGDSMNLAGIQDGDLVLVRQQPTAKDGDRVVALIDDSTTIKELCRQNMMIILKPRSTNPEHTPIILTQNFQIQGVVIQSFSNL